MDFAHDIQHRCGLEEPIYVCIDEWENLDVAQQQAMNQWIKNGDRRVTYKLGVREHGIRTRRTGNDPEDQLTSPADYVEKLIVGPDMVDFCRTVVETRLARAAPRAPGKLSEMLQGLSRHEEAALLGASKAVSKTLEDDPGPRDPTIDAWLREARAADAYLAVYHAERTGKTIQNAVEIARAGSRTWRNLIANYGHLSLFAVTRGQLGSVRRKFYCGERTFLELSCGNIRHLLELLNEAVRRHLRLNSNDPAGASDTLLFVSSEVQTDAAIAVAKAHLDQLEGLSDQGLEIVRLVRSVGAAYGAVVREPRRVAPECTSFTLGGKADDVRWVRQVLAEGVAALAFLRDTVTKRTAETEDLADEYRIHPLLTPHFSMPYRRKRKSTLDASLLRSAATERGGAKKLYASIVGEDIDDAQMDLLGS